MRLVFAFARFFLLFAFETPSRLGVLRLGARSVGGTWELFFTPFDNPTNKREIKGRGGKLEIFVTRMKTGQKQKGTLTQISTESLCYTTHRELKAYTLSLYIAFRGNISILLGKIALFLSS